MRKHVSNSGPHSEHITEGAGKEAIMTTTARPQPNILFRTIIALVLLISALTPVLSISRVESRQPTGAAVLELPALIFTPLDLADAGFAGYRLTPGQLGGTSELASIAGEWTDQTTNDDIQTTLEGFGLARSYKHGFRVTQDPADSGSEVARDLIVSVHDFGTASGAAQGLALLDQLSASFSGVQRKEGNGPITATAVIVQTPPSDSTDPVAQMTLAIQVDRLLGLIEVIDYRNQEPTTAELETLAGLLSSRITAGLAGDTPGLGTMALRLKDVEFESLYEVRLDEYQRRDGKDFAYILEDDQVGARRSLAAGEAIDAYAFNQFVQDTDAIDASLPFQFGWVSRMYGFADEQAASAWLAGRPDQIQAISDEPVQEVQPIAGAPTVGDESLSVTYVEGGDFPSKIYRTFLRVGNRTADIYLTSGTSDPFPETTIQRFASVQAQCLTAGCPDPILITDVLRGVVPAATPQAQSATPTAQTFTDLAARTLTPADLAALQMPDYGVGLAYTTYPDAWFQSVADYRGVPEDQVHAAVDAAGFVRRYDNYLDHPAEVTNPNGGIGQTVVSYIVEFSSAAGAASVFDFLEDESANPDAADLPLASPIGDRAEATHLSGQDASTGKPYDQIDLTFQLGPYHAGVAVIDWQGQPVSQPQVELLAHRLLERLSSGDQTDPDLSNVVLRIGGEIASTTSDHYLLLGSRAIAQYGESASALSEREQSAAGASQTDSYQVQQQLALGTAGTEDDLGVTVDVTRFADDAAAHAWMAALPQLVSTNTGFTNAQFVQFTAIGDETVGYSVTSADGSLAYRSVALRVGRDVAVIDITGTSFASPLMIAALADAQAQCLLSADCPMPYQLPSGFQ
jgi:hypothetical protein